MSGMWSHHLNHQPHSWSLGSSVFCPSVWPIPVFGTYRHRLRIGLRSRHKLAVQVGQSSGPAGACDLCDPFHNLRDPEICTNKAARNRRRSPPLQSPLAGENRRNATSVPKQIWTAFFRIPDYIQHSRESFCRIHGIEQDAFCSCEKF